MKTLTQECTYIHSTPLQNGCFGKLSEESFSFRQMLLQSIISNHNDWKNVAFQETKQDIIEFCHSSTTLQIAPSFDLLHTNCQSVARLNSALCQIVEGMPNFVTFSRYEFFKYYFKIMKVLFRG